MNKLFLNFSLFVIFIGVFQSYAFSCEIKAPKSLIVTENVESYELKSAFQYKSCTDEQIKAFNILLTDYSGDLNQRVLHAELNDKRIKLLNSFKVTTLSTAINSRIHLPKKWKIVELKLIGQGSGYFALQNEEHLQISCNNCNNTGAKNIRLNIVNPVSNTKASHWLTGDVAIAVEALVSKDNISITNEPLTKRNFELKTVYSSRPENFFTFADKLPYYRANRPLRSGHVVKFNDISPLNLVNMGTPVQIKLNSNGLKLQAVGIPTRSGKLGEIIQLKNPKTNKIIIGKITNFNEVEVEL